MQVTERDGKAARLRVRGRHGKLRESELQNGKAIEGIRKNGVRGTESEYKRKGTGTVT